MTREIVLDTETTGLSPNSGDRIVEIGCVELINHVPTGKNFHVYLNPERSMPEEAFRVHGLSEEFLSDKSLFKDEVEGLLEFIADGTLVIHNASFDMGFLNAELKAIGMAHLANNVIDTVQVARERHPGARVSLDALCKHYGIDNSRRSLHGALLDSEILAEVYLELIGGRQVALSLSAAAQHAATQEQSLGQTRREPRPTPLASRLTKQEKTAHDKLIASFGDKAVWLKYGSRS